MTAKPYASLQRIVDHYDARSELYTNDGDCAAGMADIARAAINRRRTMENVTIETPWTVRPEVGPYPNLVICGKEGGGGSAAVATVFAGKEAAYKLAAAPQMYDALCEIRRHMPLSTGLREKVDAAIRVAQNIPVLPAASNAGGSLDGKARETLPDRDSNDAARLDPGPNYGDQQNNEPFTLGEYPPESAEDLQASRYQRLRILGCAPCDTPQLDAGTVLRFQSLDAFVDEDIKRVPSRGEFIGPAGAYLRTLEACNDCPPSRPDPRTTDRARCVVDVLRVAYDDIQRMKRQDAALTLRPSWDIINLVPEVIELLEASVLTEKQRDELWQHVSQLPGVEA